MSAHRAGYSVRPLSDRTWLNPRNRISSRFTSTWVDTEDLLLRELDMLSAKHVVIGVDVQESDLRINGTLRARAKAASPGVEVAFESKHGPLVYRCDRYSDTPYFNKMELWQHNVRAIALTLEALRAVDRHGSSHAGEQYQGFKAIGSGRTSASTGNFEFSYDEAVAFLESEAALGFVGGNGLALKTAYRHAVRKHHPDRGGDPEMWAKVDAAKRALIVNGVPL